MNFDKDMYMKVDNLLSRDICKIAERYALYDRYNDKREDMEIVDCHSKYADSLMESLLIFLKPEMEKHTGLKLIPTVSFYRIYKDGHILKDHTDRPACEISVTIPLGFKYNGKSDEYLWPLHVYVNEEKRYIPCDIGDGLIYKGCELKHGRESLDADEGSYQIQVFLHYVDANGPYAEKYKYDGRPNIGIQQRFTDKVIFNYYIEPEIIPNLLTEDEIEYIKKEAKSKLQASDMCVPVADGRPRCRVDEQIRKSETAWLESSDPIINNLMRKCSSRLKRSIGHCEDLQVVRYKTGGFYKQHQDIIESQLNNKRRYTFMFALNDDYEGGETSFPNLDIKYKLKKGDCLFFHTLDNYDALTSMALHGEQPVKSGEKWVCNLWVHEYPHA